MWYLIVIFVILGTIILLPIFRYRKFWKTALKDSELKYYDSIKMMINHIRVCFVPNKHNYCSYIGELKSYVDDSDAFIWVFMVILLVVVWPATITIFGIIFIINFLINLITKLVRNSINKKRL